MCKIKFEIEMPKLYYIFYIYLFLNLWEGLNEYIKKGGFYNRGRGGVYIPSNWKMKYINTKKFTNFDPPPHKVNKVIHTKFLKYFVLLFFLQNSLIGNLE